jgi:hypothetical protein
MRKLSHKQLVQQINEAANYIATNNRNNSAEWVMDINNYTNELNILLRKEKIEKIMSIINGKLYRR